MVTQSYASVSPPLQERSQKTLDALLAAAEAQLAHKPFADITVTSIVKEARSSSGSFYARFPDKSVLLHALHERFVNRSIERAEQLQRAFGHQQYPIEKIADRLVDNIVAVHNENRGLIRSVLIEAATDAVFYDRASDLVKKMSSIVSPCVDAGGMPRKTVATEIEIGILTLLAILDQDLFSGSVMSTVKNKKCKGATGYHERLRRVFLASMDLK